MALDTYGSLKSAIEDWSKRTDIATALDDFIDITESRINSGLLMFDNITRSTLNMSAGSRFVTLPTDFLQMRRLTVTGNRYTELQSVAPEAMEIKTASGRPTYYTVTSQLEFDRPADSAYTLEISYFTKLSALSTSNTTNNVLTKYPELYLYGCLAACHRWARDEPTAAYYDQLFSDRMALAKRQERRGMHGPNPAMIQRGRNP